jgi:hypothetical protein
MNRSNPQPTLAVIGQFENVLFAIELSAATRLGNSRRLANCERLRPRPIEQSRWAAKIVHESYAKTLEQKIKKKIADPNATASRSLRIQTQAGRAGIESHNWCLRGRSAYADCVKYVD